MANPAHLDPTNDVLNDPYLATVDWTPGDPMDIYHDPLFINDLEDTGSTMVKHIASTEQMERWLVRLTNGLLVDRWIKKQIVT